MGNFQNLKNQAAVIRDEQQDYKNTALRIGKMFVDMLEQLEDVLPDENVQPDTLTVEPTETSYKLKFSTIASDGSIKSREVSLPLATDTKAGIMSPAMLKGVKDQIAGLNKNTGVSDYPEWKANSTYAQGEIVRNPYGELVKSKNEQLDSGESYNEGLWETTSLDKENREKVAELSNISYLKKITGELYQITADTIENKVYFTDGSNQDSTEKTYIYMLDIGTNVKIKISTYFPTENTVHIAYVNENGTFFTIADNNIKEGYEFYLTITPDIKKLLVCGGDLLGINTDISAIIDEREIDIDTMVRPITGVSYSITPNKVEENTCYKINGETITVNGYNSNTYKLSIGTSVKIKVSKDFLTDDLAVIGYRNKDGVFKSILESVIHSDNIPDLYLTITDNIEDLIICGCTIEGIDTDYNIVTEEDISVKKNDVYGDIKEALPYAVTAKQAWFLDKPFEFSGILTSVNIPKSNVENSTLYVLIAKKEDENTLSTVSVAKCLVNTGENVLENELPFESGYYVGFVAQDSIIGSRTTTIDLYGSYNSSGNIEEPQVGLKAVKNSLNINFDISYNVVYYQRIKDIVSSNLGVKYKIPKNLVNVGMSIWWLDGEPHREVNTIDGEGTIVIGYQTLLQQIFEFDSITKYTYSGCSLGAIC